MRSMPRDKGLTIQELRVCTRIHGVTPKNNVDELKDFEMYILLHTTTV